MNTTRPRSALTFLASLTVATPAFAQGDSGFLRGEGQLDVAVSYALDTYDEFWIGDTKVEDPPFGRVNRHSANVWAGYGLSDEVDLSFSAAYVYVETDALFDDLDALQDLTVQTKWRFHSMELGNGTLNLLAAPAVKLPMTHYEDNQVFAVGDGNVDFRVRGIIQYLCDNGAFLARDRLRLPLRRAAR